MSNDQQDMSLEDTLEKMQLFFPEKDAIYTPESVNAALQKGDIFIRNTDMLPYIQTAFFDEKIMEVELDGNDDIYFSRLYDHLPELEETTKNGLTFLEEPLYKCGSYLLEMNHLISLPVEPGMGNLYIRNSQKILLRFFTSRTGIELGTFFDTITLVQGLPVLRLSYPVIGRKINKSRAYRANVPVDILLYALITGKNKKPDMVCVAIEASVEGMSFLIKKEEQKLFRVGETRKVQLLFNGELYTKINVIVRHVSKIRSKYGTQYRCGVQFELTTRSITADIETLVATIQRAHLQELAEKSAEHRVTLIR